MTGKTHQLAGVATGVIVSQFVPTVKGKLLFVAGCWFGSLIPDIDHANSKISRMTILLHYLFAWCGHRTLTHSIVGVLLFSLIMIPLGVNTATIGLVIGYMSHLLMDSLTVAGIPLFYPHKKKYRLMRIRTGSEGEVVVFGMIVLAMILYFYILFDMGGLK